METKKETFEELKKMNEPVALGKKIRVIPVETYSRVVGYYQVVSNWNVGKKEEMKERVTISLKKFQEREKSIINELQEVE